MQGKGGPVLTTKEAAALLGVSPRRVNNLIEVGALKAQKFGRAWMVDEASVRERVQAKTKNINALYTL